MANAKGGATPISNPHKQYRKEVLAKLDLIAQKLDLVRTSILQLATQVATQGGKTMAILDALTAEVSRNTDVDTSAVVLLNKLADLIRNTQGDPTAVNALADQLKSSSDALAAAVVANTPAEPPAP